MDLERDNRVSLGFQAHWGTLNPEPVGTGVKGENVKTLFSRIKTIVCRLWTDS